MNVPVAVAEDVAEDVAVAVGWDVAVGKDVTDVLVEGDDVDVAVAVADADAEEEAEDVAEAEEEDVAVAEEEDVADAVAEAEEVADVFAWEPTIISGQQNWSVVEYKPEAKIHPYDAPRKLQLGPLIISQLDAVVEQNCCAFAWIKLQSGLPWFAGQPDAVCVNCAKLEQPYSAVAVERAASKIAIFPSISNYYIFKCSQAS